MKLDRNIPGNAGKGKYALLLLRNIPSLDQQGYGAVQSALDTLEQNGVLDWGYTNTPDEFFLIRLRDRNARAALLAYAAEANRTDPEWSAEVAAMSLRAGDLSPHCKTPD